MKRDTDCNNARKKISYKSNRIQQQQIERSDEKNEINFNFQPFSQRINIFVQPFCYSCSYCCWAEIEMYYCWSYFNWNKWHILYESVIGLMQTNFCSLRFDENIFTWESNCLMTWFFFCLFILPYMLKAFSIVCSLFCICCTKLWTMGAAAPNINPFISALNCISLTYSD